jgi:hypothetical protein
VTILMLINIKNEVLSTFLCAYNLAESPNRIRLPQSNDTCAFQILIKSFKECHPKKPF